jgi:hypothetical protein
VLYGPRPMQHLDRLAERFRRRTDLLWLAVLLAVVAFLKLRYSATFAFPSGVDGGLYTDVAQNIRDGRGLVTNVSIFHAGYAHFPHPTALYPLWPMLYGFTAKLLPIATVAVWLPTLLYFASLLLAYRWASELCPEPFSKRWAPGFGAGHVLVAMIGLHKEYFVHTSQPYTEALSYALFFAFLLRTSRRLRVPSFGGGLEIGVWLGLCFLARSQFAILVLAVVGPLAWYAIAAPNERRTYAVLSLGTLVGIAIPFVPYAVYATRAWGYFDLSMLFLFGETPETSPLSQSQPYRSTGLGTAIWDRIEGFGRAYFGKRTKSYRDSYYLFGYALPIALAIASPALRHMTRGNLRRAWAVLCDPKHRYTLILVLLAIGGFLSLHVLVKTGGGGYFNRRHNLVAIPAFFLSTVWLCRHRLLAIRGLGALLIVTSLATGIVRVDTLVRHAESHPAQPFHRELARWLNREHAQRGDFTVAFSGSAQYLVWQTPGVSYHWMNRGTKLSDVRIMFDKLGTSLFVLDHWAPRRSRFRAKQRDIDRDFVEIHPGEFRQYNLYRRRRADDPPSTSTPPRPQPGSDLGRETEASDDFL